jgi:hypothetical protein
MSQPPMPPGPPTEPLPQPQSQTWPLLGTRTPISRAAAPDGLQPQQGPVPVQQQPKKPTRFGWPTMIVTAVVALSLGGIVGGVVGGSGNGTATTAEPNPTVTVSQTVTETAEAKPASKAPSPKKTTEPEPKSTISDGVHEVGVDVKAGQYEINVPEGALCYWERRIGDAISDSTSRYKEGPARLSVTLKKGEVFETEDCGTWTRV